jgi:hypothetical protein
MPQHVRSSSSCLFPLAAAAACILCLGLSLAGTLSCGTFRIRAVDDEEGGAALHKSEAFETGLFLRSKVIVSGDDADAVFVRTRSGYCQPYASWAVDGLDDPAWSTANNLLAIAWALTALAMLQLVCGACCVRRLAYYRCAAVLLVGIAVLHALVLKTALDSGLCHHNPDLELLHIDHLYETQCRLGVAAYMGIVATVGYFVLGAILFAGIGAYFGRHENDPADTNQASNEEVDGVLDYYQQHNSSSSLQHTNEGRATKIV